MPAADMGRDPRGDARALLEWWEDAAPNIETENDLDAAAEELGRPGSAIGAAARAVIEARRGDIDLYVRKSVAEGRLPDLEVGDLRDWERLLLALTLAMLPAGRYWLSREVMGLLRAGEAHPMLAPIGLYGSVFWFPIPGCHMPDFTRLASLKVYADGAEGVAIDASGALAALADAFSNGLALDNLTLRGCVVDLGGIGEVANLLLLRCEVVSAPPPGRSLKVDACDGAGLSALVRGSAGRASSVHIISPRGGENREPLVIGGPGLRYDRLRLTDCAVAGEIVANIAMLYIVELRGTLAAGAARVCRLSGDYRLTAGVVDVRNEEDPVAGWLGGATLAASANDAPGGSAIIAPRMFGLARGTPVAGRLRVAGVARAEEPPAAAAIHYAFDGLVFPGALAPAAPVTVRALSMLRRLPAGARPRVVRASLFDAGGDYEVLCFASWCGDGLRLRLGRQRPEREPPARVGLLAVVGDAAELEGAAVWLAGHRGAVAAVRVLATTADGGEADAAALAAAVGGVAAGAADRARLAALGWLSSPVVAAWPYWH